MSNESKWLTAIGGIVAAVVPLLIAYGLLTAEQGELWQSLVMAVAALVVPIVVGSIVRNYNEHDAFLRHAAIELEQARLMASQSQGVVYRGYAAPAGVMQTEVEYTE